MNDALDNIEMRGSQSVHKETCLLDGVRDLGTSECEVQKSSGETAIVSRVIKKITVIDRELGSRVDRCFGGVAVVHPGGQGRIVAGKDEDRRQNE
jgi:hypothetical protein